MPNIRQYDAGNLALRPSETGIEARAAAARRIGATYNQVGGATQQLGQETAQLGALKGHVTSQFGGALAQGISDAGSAAVRYMDHQQISHGALGLAGLFANATQEWQDIAKNGDPNDPTLAKRFLEERLEPALEKFRSGFTTERSQAWAESHIDSLRQHFFTSTTATMSTLAGQAVALNHRQTVNQLSATVRQDPSGLDAAIGLVEGATNGVVDSSPNLSATAASRARTELTQSGKEALVKSAVQGMIDKNPNLDLSKIEAKYGAYITPGELQQFQKYAQSRAKADLLTEKQTQAYNKQQDQLVAHGKLSKAWTDNVSFDENGKATIKPQIFNDVMTTIRDHPESARAEGEHIINWARKEGQEKRQAVVDDPVVAGDLHDRLFSPDNPTTQAEILEAEYQGKISAHTRMTLLNLDKALEEKPLKGPIYQGAMNAAKELLGANVMPDGKQRYENFVQSFIPQLIAKSRQGTLEPNWADTKDPNSMISKALAPYKPSDSELLYNKLLPKKYQGIISPQGTLLGSQKAFVPPPDWQWRNVNGERQFMDPSGKIYDASGKPVKK